VRKVLPMAAVLAWAAAVVPAPAQVTLSSLTGGSAKAPTTSSTPTTATLLTNAANMSQMLPKYNLNGINKGVLASTANPRQFNFAKMLPSFSFLKKGPPTKAGGVTPAPQLKNPISLNNR
jgi:hypothetical protein